VVELTRAFQGKAYLDDMIKDTLGKLSDTGPPLAIRKELRDVEPDLKSYYGRLEKATGVSGWKIEIEVCSSARRWCTLTKLVHRT
jgi:hypothetical protein